MFNITCNSVYDALNKVEIGDQKLTWGIISFPDSSISLLKYTILSISGMWENSSGLVSLVYQLSPAEKTEGKMQFNCV